MIGKMALWLIPVIWGVSACYGMEVTRNRNNATTLEAYDYWKRRGRITLCFEALFGVMTGLIITQLIQQY